MSLPFSDLSASQQQHGSGLPGASYRSSFLAVSPWLGSARRESFTANALKACMA